MSATVKPGITLAADETAAAHGVSFAEAFKVWLRVALLSFGGPAGQIAVMHRIVVEERRWISEARFLHALNYCHLLPGPEAQQLAIYIGWLMHKTRGGLGAGVLFVVPGVIALMALSWIYVIWGSVSFVAGLFFGLKAAVLAVVIEAVLRVGRRALKSKLAVVIAAAAFVALFFFAVPFPLVVAAAAIIGFAADRLGYAMAGHAAHGKDDDLLGEHIPDHARPSLARAVKVVTVWVPLWLGPVALLFLFLGSDNILPGSRCSSARSRCSASAAPTLCWPMSRSRPSIHIIGFVPAKCWRASAWPKRHPVRSSWSCSMSAFSRATGRLAPCRLC
jgi:chromate transporter